MEIIKYDNALKGNNSDKCKTLEYSFNDKEMYLGVATINGRYPDKGYGVNLVSKELIYVIEGKGKLNFENKVKVKKLIFVCGFNNYLGINEQYDVVNKSMYLDNLEDVKQHADEIICFYSNNDPYVKYDVEKDFADKIATKQVLIPNAGHINSESGYDTFEEIVHYI